jgi:hypothetical protein
MRVFKSELREALGDPGQLPGDELWESVEYSDGSDEAFLGRLWRDLYGDEPPGPPRGLFDPDPEFRGLETSELLAMVPRTGESVLRRGRALMELGRRASSCLRPRRSFMMAAKARVLAVTAASPGDTARMASRLARSASASRSGLVMI